MGKIQYQIEYMIESDVLDIEIEFTEKEAIDRAKEVMSLNTEKGSYVSISKLEQEIKDLKQERSDYYNVS